MDNRRILFRFPLGAGDSSLLQSIHTAAGAPPASYLVGTLGRFLGIQRPGHETDHLMARLRIPVAIHPLPYTPSWFARHKFTFGLLFTLQLYVLWDLEHLILNRFPVVNISWDKNVALS